MCTQGSAQVPECIPFPTKADQYSWRAAPGRTFTDIAADQDVGGGIPKWRGFRHIVHHTEPSAGGRDNPFDFAPQEFRARDEQDVTTVSGEPGSGFRAGQ